MIITTEICAKVQHFSKKITKTSSQHEDVAQETLLNLHRYDKPVQYLSSFLYTSVRHVYLDQIRRTNNQIRFEQQYYDLSPKDTKIDDCGLLLTSILNIFKDQPAKYKIVLLIANNPDMRIIDLAKLSGGNIETFKANIRHIRQALKKSHF